jgi:hypothetical protein
MRCKRSPKLQELGEIKNPIGVQKAFYLPQTKMRIIPLDVYPNFLGWILRGKRLSFRLSSFPFPCERLPISFCAAF